MNKKRMGLKIGAFILAMILIGIIGSLANAFLGNPVSAALAARAVRAYAEEHYSHLDLVLERPVYNFKFNEYMVRARSKTSIDTRFNISYRRGKIIRDDYDANVLRKYNTLARLEKELEQEITPILAAIPELQDLEVSPMVEKWEYEEQNEAVQLDMEYDQSLPIDFTLYMNAFLKDETMEGIEAILVRVHEVLAGAGYGFTSYSLYLRGDETAINVINVTPDDIESGELLHRLEFALNHPPEEVDKKLLNQSPTEEDDIDYEEGLQIRIYKKSIN